MTGQLDVIREGNLGIIALNRPEAINALSLEMIDGITRALEQWADDEEIRLVLFEGRGPRGFCSGGDVRAVRRAVLDGEAAKADAFFAAEYRMNGIIARYRKPTVALTHGIVMGGGIGIAGHCAFRFTTAEARFAMPEAAIGFTCDVGVNFILSKAPVHRALAFAMTGVPVGVADALALGLTDCAIDPARRDAVRAGIAAAAAAPRIDAALGALMQAEMAPVGEAALCAAADRQHELDWTDTAAIVGIAGQEPQLAQLVLRSPTSLVAIGESHHAARRLADIADVLAADLRLARLLCRLPDFAEGVRAVLVDKDQKPQWRPNALAGVDRTSIRAVISAA
ncbi:MAG TPA: 3-hydroxyisobutyryl-CoA hydrolase [Devosia sp.]|jgi:enoyl-CoA hydratase|uniref:3-hydroxyisobutyryl-CoA hydrolase n=1 Tax=Devosia sp. TaxID=1871048 RepID=UPI002DDC9B8B|nr:3-hydroxyisobutyryl-CoA hydrolase [Devosia sp.]HEV2517745.1 3-hydroxyisobutyryl-CoA hydrolase [Devosia sp.]